MNNFPKSLIPEILALLQSQATLITKKDELLISQSLLPGGITLYVKRRTIFRRKRVLPWLLHWQAGSALTLVSETPVNVGFDANLKKFFALFR